MHIAKRLCDGARALRAATCALLMGPTGCVQAARRRTHAARSTLLQASQQALGLGRLTAEEKCEVASAEMEAVQATADQVNITGVRVSQWGNMLECRAEDTLQHGSRHGTSSAQALHLLVLMPRLHISAPRKNIGN